MVLDERKYLIAAICCGLVLRLLALLSQAAIEMDGINYATMADQFLHGFFREALSNVFSPMYPAVIALFHLVVPDVELAGRLASVVFGILLIFLCFFFSKRLVKSETKAVWLVFLLALHPYLIRYSGQVLSESVATFLFTLTVFSFYIGWQEQKNSAVGLAGFCLVLTYLARPEYLVFYAPFVLLLAREKRIGGILVLFLPFLILGSIYILYLHAQTGLWIISNKVTTSPFVSLRTFFVNIPLVVYEFFVAMFFPFLFFAFFGFGRLNGAYKLLLLILIPFHILSLASVGHATKRYSVEFIPLVMIAAAEGIPVVRSYLRRFFPNRAVNSLMVGVMVVAGVFQSFTPFRHDRALIKEAGLFLRSYDPGRVVAARLPIAAFYGKSTNVNLPSVLPEKAGPEEISRILSEREVRYVIVDEQTDKEFPNLSAYLSGRGVLREFRARDLSLRIYRVSNE